MSLQKLASLVRTVGGRNVLSPTVKSRVIPYRERSHILAGPPRGNSTKREMLVMSTIVAIAILFTPAWVIFHMKEYTAPLREADKP